MVRSLGVVRLVLSAVMNLFRCVSSQVDMIFPLLF